MSADTPARLRAAHVFSWQLAHWTRRSPGRMGTVLFAALPLVLFIPHEWIGIFDSWNQGAVAVLSLGALILALVSGRDLAAAAPTELWVYQKGVSLADWGLNRWVASTVIAAGLVLWWTVLWTVASAFYRQPIGVSQSVAVFVWLVAVLLMVNAVLFLLAAAGSDRGAELVLVLMLAAAMQPLLERMLPGLATDALRLLLPPLQPAATLRGSLSAGEAFRIVVPPLVHVSAFVVATLGIGTWLLARRRPLR